MTPLLEVAGLVKRFGGLTAIDNVDLTLMPGAITGVIGPNGAGKSTLIGLIGGALAPSGGAIALDGRDVTRLPASERARAGVGRTYQIPRPFLDMTVEENLEVAQFAIEPFISVHAAREARHGLLVRCGLADATSKPARALPLLRRKRLEVARALALKPRILLLDEVAAGLIESEIGELIALIKSLADPGRAILIVEHVIRVVRECCASSVVLNFGKKLIEGPTGDILANDQVAAIYLGTGAGGARKEPSAGANGDARPSEIQVGVPDRERAALAPLVVPRKASAGPLLRLERVEAGYGQARVLIGIDLAVESGQAVAVLGANGAGKTTLARVISGSLAPASGAVAFDGRPVAGLGAHRVAELGVAHCMEGRRVFPTLSVEENLRIAVRGADGATIGLARSTTSFLCSRSARIHRGPQCRAGSSRCSQLPAR